MDRENRIVRKRINVSGQVQGVGFRPFVYKLANSLGLVGFVANNTSGAIIEIEGTREKIEEFQKLLVENQPALAKIKSIRISDIEVLGDKEFTIVSSRIEGSAEADVTVDTCICDDCLREMFDPNDRRYRYAFINCTNCGPRYTIVRNVPYDRPNTTMSKFQMCDRCRSEYENPNDRRFHAQPIACPECGPHLYLQGKYGEQIEGEPIEIAAEYLRSGKIVAIKGIGGFHLAVDACNDEAVLRLRRLKRRDMKPFAMMVSSIEDVEKICILDEQSKLLLEDIARPIVLLEKKEGTNISPNVAPGLNRFGIMLPYAPCHYLLFSMGLGPLVMTSGNFSEEPIISDNNEAIEKLRDIVDLFLMHNRDIYRKIDDSVVQSNGRGGLIMLRRARGFVPQSLELGHPNSKNILGVGAELKSTIAIAKSEKVIVSEHIGDLKEPSSFEHFRSVIGHLSRLYEVRPEVIVADMHNDYLSSQYAIEKFDLELIRVQHHHCHIVSCMLEHNLNEKVIGISADGVGIGTDGAVWGCEIMIADRKDFRRIGHLEYFSLPGGDAAAKQTFRPALGLLYLTFGENAINMPIAQKVCNDSQTRKMLFEMLIRKINSPMTSSLGRLFDGVAGLCGVAMQNYYEGYAPMLLESLAKGVTDDKYEFDIVDKHGKYVINIKEMIRAIVADIDSGTDVNIISDKFHNTVADFLSSLAIKVAESNSSDKIVVSGGCFANRRLSLLIETKLNRSGIRCYQHCILPCGDGGISAGQVAIAAAQMA